MKFLIVGFEEQLGSEVESLGTLIGINRSSPSREVELIGVVGGSILPVSSHSQKALRFAICVVVSNFVTAGIRVGADEEAPGSFENAGRASRLIFCIVNCYTEFKDHFVAQKQHIV